MLKTAVIVAMTIFLLSLLSACGVDKRPQHYAPDSIRKTLLSLFAVLAILVLVLFFYLSPSHKNPYQYTYTWYAPPQASTVPPIAPNPGPAYQQATFQNLGNVVEEILYHGTPNLANAVDITDPCRGFIIGPGNAFGTGLYLADLVTAMGFAKGTGSILKIKLEAPSIQITDLNFVEKSADFINWCFLHGSSNHGDDITNYTLGVLKKRFIKVSGQNIYVALANQTFGSERVVFEGLTILDILDAQGNPL